MVSKAMGSSVEIRLGPLINDLLSSLWNCSFLLVLYPAGMSDRRSLAIWQRRFSISSNADLVSGLDGTFVQRSRKVFKLHSILWFFRVHFTRNFPQRKFFSNIMIESVCGRYSSHYRLTSVEYI